MNYYYPVEGAVKPRLHHESGIDDDHSIRVRLFEFLDSPEDLGTYFRMHQAIELLPPGFVLKNNLPQLSPVDGGIRV